MSQWLRNLTFQNINFITISFWIGVSIKLNEVFYVSIETQYSINAYYTVENINFCFLVSTEYSESESYIAWMSLNFQFSLSASKVLELCVCVKLPWLL